jgi:uncharacterized RDD family membrane protein YckC
MSNILDDSGASSSSPSRAGFGVRFGAFLIDGLFMAIIIYIVGYIFAMVFIKSVEGVATSGTPMTNEDAAVAVGGFMSMIMNMIWGLVIGSLLYTLVEGITGASPGKMILGLKIGTAQGGQAAMGSLLTRWALKNVNYICLFLLAATHVSIFGLISQIGSLFLLISCLMALRASKQALHDDIAGTAVFKKTDTFA